MKYRFFFVSALYPDVGETELNRFLGQHAVLAVDKHFTHHHDQPGWSFVVSYDDGTTGSSSSPRKARQSIDYRELLSEQDFAVYSELRRLRKQVSTEQAIPPYTVFTNEQLAQMVRRQVASIEDLAIIEGIGQVRLDRYGALFLQRLQSLLQQEGQR